MLSSMVLQVTCQGFLKAPSEGNADAASTEVAAPSLDDPNAPDPGLKKDLQEEVQNLRDAIDDNGESDVDKPFEKWASQDDNRGVDQLENQVNDLEAKLTESESEKSEEINEVSGDSSLIQNDVEDFSASTAAADIASDDADVSGFDAYLQDELKQRHDDENNNTNLLQDMVGHLLDQAKTFKKNQNATKEVEPEVISVLLQKLTKHLRVLGQSRLQRQQETMRSQVSDDEDMDEGDDLDEDLDDGVEDEGEDTEEDLDDIDDASEDTDEEVDDVDEVSDDADDIEDEADDVDNDSEE